MRKLSHDEIPRLSPAELSGVERHPISLLLHNIRSAHNVGSIFRSADAALVEKIYLSGFTPDPSHKGVRKSALGAGDYVPWERSENVSRLLERTRTDGITIASLEITTTPVRPSDLDASRFPVLLIVGNEVEGVAQSLIDASDLALELPQFGAKQSLNVSVAAGIAVYDLVRTYRSL